ncbi:catalase family peroxidase [Gluconacetobacter takamatsuzukensis]|uniref:Catalase-related peroxidase n=1 Tax=Gluconacetobacter takamatsuzukensis TaxID=1286190 RepID=A0A7W4PSK9_9PROT|nr:catalase family peroxidase [Gluconacetobacter takamatsuzukensis]MBB2205046.1 catalase family peroxidase [Gluconacetobacter takamatsuzukensis]
MMSLIRERLAEKGGWLRAAAMCAAPGLLALAFALAAGWLTPGRLTSGTFMRTFRMVDGPHPGFRRNHAKGLCVTGWFEGSGNATPLSRAPLFAMVRSPVVGRFALAGGMPFQDDAPEKVRSLALRIMPAHGGEWRMGINDIPVFPVRNAKDFNDFLLASRPDPQTHHPDPARMGAFLAHHPETQQALALLKARPLTSGFANDTYNSLDSFTFVNTGGTATAVRWAMVPDQPASLPAGQGAGRDYLFHDLIAALAQGPLRWHLIVTVGGAGDATADPTVPWPAGRRQIDAGTLTLDRAESEDGGPCKGITYDPLILPEGIAPSDDPIPAARSAVYARSFTLRSGEPDTTSAIGRAAIRPGEQ